MTRSAARANPHLAPNDAAKKARGSLKTVVSLLPYLWPKGETGLRVKLVLACIAMLLAKLGTVYVPVVYGHLVDKLTHTAGPLALPLALIGGYVAVRIASAAFGELRDALFAGVQMRASRVVARKTFEHLHALSMRFHLDRQTGGLSNIILRGTLGIQSVLRLATFNLVPTIIELLLTTAMLWYLFNIWYGLIAFVAIGFYIGFTLIFTTWRTKFRRTMNETDNEAQTKAIDSLLNFETVKYFGNETHESSRFDESLARYETASVKSQVTLNMLNIGQAVIISLALGVMMVMAAHSVLQHKMTVGSFVLVNTYLLQLYVPLNFLGFAYLSLNQGLVDMEQMFTLMRVNQEVQDKPGALPIASHGVPAEIRFEDVRFAYNPDRQILKGVSFTATPGKKIAIVGPTGSGKSTISRLVFRFYDVTGGRVLVDGHDVRDIKQHALRAAIGVVPQDTVLFNDSIFYNIAYGRPGATRAEVEHAARLAQIHGFIESLPQGYETKVGERGLKLSGGEKQRVAIARTILKDPRILILDEATSALDTATEQGISAALRSVAQHRTTLVIAHRLSTVTDSDEILVLREGAVVERGTHTALLAEDGIYASMWAAQAVMEHEEAAADGANATPPEKTPENAAE
ncbi:ABCB family ABC transporter ATP-binding protein/permease [Acidocella aminolytica]|uniref:ABC transporter multidrug resistance n=1 Tax=Acidocella aminolytica 101 = DSM 11237 TaxID=1120923 RepID=A0A0D6PFK8_9PROT|nr:ABC transporter ATP-binding protein/permease [Acidocella aminolytica]GAN80467.1 ABC transporter multidrug resistance [Acidocella aminolytica 101 = DSM 11237]GBQ35867.1 multidrug ABC transporter ATP-binding protein [Acidocella aminolytica 101 = DSM 11237]